MALSEAFALDIALIGLASSGKSTLLRALASGHLPGHGSPTEATLSVVKVPDERLDRLATLVLAKKTTYLEQRIHDFPGFSDAKKGPPAQLLGLLQTADILIHVVHAFDDPATPHPLESIDPDRDIQALDLELMLADLGVIERRLDRLKAESRSVAAANRGAIEREQALLTRLKEALEQEKPASSVGINAEEKASLGGFNLLTLKPMLIVLNISESDLPRAAEIEAEAKVKYAGLDRGVAAISVKAEADVAELPPEDAAEFRKDMELPEITAAERVLQEVVSLLGLITFYTAGPQDTRAWSIPAGTIAQKAAGRIHSDIERGFIRAEVMTWTDLLEAGSHVEAKKKGLLRVEGKTYEMRDGDVINVLFNV